MSKGTHSYSLFSNKGQKRVFPEKKTNAGKIQDPEMEIPFWGLFYYNKAGENPPEKKGIKGIKQKKTGVKTSGERMTLLE